MIAQFLAAYRRWKLERRIVSYDLHLDSIRAGRIVGYMSERDIEAKRAEAARQLQTLAYDNINRRTA